MTQSPLLYALFLRCNGIAEENEKCFEQLLANVSWQRWPTFQIIQSVNAAIL